MANVRGEYSCGEYSVDRRAYLRVQTGPRLGRLNSLDEQNGILSCCVISHDTQSVNELNKLAVVIVTVSATFDLFPDN